MHRFSRALLALMLLLSCSAAWADSVDPDLKRLIREAKKPKVHYGPARVGWNGPEMSTTPPVNATYESLRVDSPAALRQELKRVLFPQWQVLAAFLIMIFGLRMLLGSRGSAGDASDGPSNVVPFPSQLPRQEAA